MKIFSFLILFFVSVELFAVAKEDTKNNRKVINLFQNKKVSHSFGGKAIAKNKLDDAGRPVDEDEIEVENNLKAPFRVINLRDVQKSVFEESKPEATKPKESAN